MLAREDCYGSEEDLPKRELYLSKNPWEEYETMKRQLREELLECRGYELRIKEIVDFLEI